jgi:hypothetical protein
MKPALIKNNSGDKMNRLNLEIGLERDVMILLPGLLVGEIDYIVESSTLGYISREQFILEAIRTKIELNQIISMK